MASPIRCILGGSSATHSSVAAIGTVAEQGSVSCCMLDHFPKSTYLCGPTGELEGEGLGWGLGQRALLRLSLPTPLSSPQRGGRMQWEESLGTESAPLPGLSPFW